MRQSEVEDLDVCVICAKPVRHNIGVIGEFGSCGQACRPCLLMYSRKYNDEWVK